MSDLSLTALSELTGLSGTARSSRECSRERLPNNKYVPVERGGDDVCEWRRRMNHTSAWITDVRWIWARAAIWAHSNEISIWFYECQAVCSITLLDIHICKCQGRRVPFLYLACHVMHSQSRMMNRRGPRFGNSSSAAGSCCVSFQIKKV